jgi:pimeloyl-ACP methyl ester carboxylesterase
VDARALLAHLLTSPDPDPFGRLVLLRAFLARDANVSSGVLRAIDVALEDESLRRDPPLLPEALACVTTEERHAFERLRDDPEEGARLAERIALRHGPEIDAFSAIDDLARIAAPVALVHGRIDRVIPASQSVHAAALLAVHGVPHHLWITAMLDHGDLASPLARLGELPHLLDVLGYWFGAVRRASATSATTAQVDSSTTNGQYPMR